MAAERLETALIAEIPGRDGQWDLRHIVSFQMAILPFLNIIGILVCTIHWRIIWTECYEIKQYTRAKQHTWQIILWGNSVNRERMPPLNIGGSKPWMLLYQLLPVGLHEMPILKFFFIFLFKLKIDFFSLI